MPVLPVSNGYALRVSNLLRELTKNWRVTLVTPLGTSSVSDLEALGVTRVVPISLFGDWGAPIGAEQRRAIRELIDRVIAECSPRAAIVWAHAEVVLLENPDFPPTVLDRLDCEVVTAWRGARAARGLKPLIRALRDLAVWARHERELVHAAASVVVDGETDARALRTLSGRQSVHVVSNGVEIRRPDASMGEAVEPTVIFSGNLSYPPNVVAATWFTESVWPLVRNAVPNARFVMAGRNPGATVLALRSIPGVEVAGEVVDMFAELRAAWLAVAPVRTGTGIRTKVLEAWAAGRPVVLSPVAASGLQMDADAASLVAGSARGTAQLIIRLLKDDEARRRLGDSARALAEREYGGWRASGTRLSDLLRAAMDPDA